MNCYNLKGDISLKTILLDEDLQALYNLESKLSKISDLEIVGTYNNPYHTKEIILNTSIDVIFLETILLSFSGIVFAKQLKEINPNLQIVFVTAHEQYALDAFNVNALDYILKPITDDRLAKTIQRLSKRSYKVT